MTTKLNTVPSDEKIAEYEAAGPQYVRSSGRYYAFRIRRCLALCIC